ncbi:nickel-dependent lactate racemase [Lacrimispora sp. 210928-DFI.3.58]|uniref:nickel-dependent lactate racemase n=1 Tax=Lacrimispora sp. 210928-DFI.3.58 TaxID=2883214 RepID=UPI001D0659E7|nr:nickel-dependent lactate racemase [Lacrimispora sp. 210928-DFI.3.58]MCB7321249.1 nickel-dependent lactate racemase [Lacrimispora sp. 210928-DFI.3.58]
MRIDFPEIHTPVPGLETVTVPEMVTIHQAYDTEKIDDVVEHLRGELNNKIKDKESFQGKRICITVGSRGIPDLDKMVRVMCDTLKEWGASPFIIPSMGSHAGGKAEGQTEMLAGYNVTEETMGVPILSSMEVVQYDELDGIPLYCDKYAMESDGIVIFNKVKPHTDFRAKHESGLAKMIAIGIAKHKGAAMFHSFGFHRFGELIPPVAEKFLEKCPFAFGVGVVQNAYDDICTIEVCEKDNFMETDARLLEIAKEKIAKFLFDDIDVLIIDEIGKNISGNGHDPNVTGRNITRTFGDSTLKLKKLFVRGITPEAHHNGNGLGSCDVTTRRCLNEVDWEVTWGNCLTTGIMDATMIPYYVNTDEEAVKTCIHTLYSTDPKDTRIVHIKNTLSLETIQVSTALYESIKDLPGISYVSGPEPMKFNDEGMMD